LAQWADEYDGEKYVEKTLIEAEEVFLRAYFESDLESKLMTSGCY
jgi:hypothetical protein